MSTRGVIARRTALGAFEGVYHHWDSYPEGLGATLWTAYHSFFERNLERMLRYLLSHAWSSIVMADFSKPPGFEQGAWSRRPQCYCHGDRSEPLWVITEKNAAQVGFEFCYAFHQKEGEDRMAVYSSFNHYDGSKMIGAFGCGNSGAEWHELRDLDLNGTQPVWEQISVPNKWLAKTA